MSDNAGKALEIALKIIDAYQVGNSSSFCDTHEWDSASPEDLAVLVAPTLDEVAARANGRVVELERQRDDLQKANNAYLKQGRDARAALKAIRTLQLGEDLYLSIISEKGGFWSVKLPPEMVDLAREWEVKRTIGLAFTESGAEEAHKG